MKLKNYRPFIYFGYLLAVWSLYRIFFVQPEAVDEFLVKPVVWILPLAVYFLPKDHLGFADLGIKTKNFSSSVFLGIGLGFIFLLTSLFTNYLKYGNRLVFSAESTASLWSLVLVVLTTSIVEELVFRGYLFTALQKTVSVLPAAVIAVAMWVLVHLPIVWFGMNLSALPAFLYIFLTAVYGIGAIVVYAITGNLAAPVLLHLMWSLPIILFR